MISMRYVTHQAADDRHGYAMGTQTWFLEPCFGNNIASQMTGKRGIRDNLNWLRVTVTKMTMMGPQPGFSITPHSRI